MKQILLALAITAIAYSGAEAQQGCKTKLATKHTVVRTHKKTVAKIEQCRVLPYQVCSINADRQSVTCFKTMDPDAIKPLNDERTQYGATGTMPGKVEKPKMNTIVIKGENKGDYCIRDAENKETICYHNAGLLTRDENGFYHYGQK